MGLLAVPRYRRRAWDDSNVETDEPEDLEADSSTGQWPLVRILDLTAVVLVGAVLVQVIGSALYAAGIPSLPPTFASGGQNPLPLFSRIQSATFWANLLTGLLLLASLALCVLPRLVWDVPTSDGWPRFAPRAAVCICGLASLAAVGGIVEIGNIIGNSPVRDPSESWNVATNLAGVALNGLAALLSWFSVAYVRPAEEPSRPE